VQRGVGDGISYIDGQVSDGIVKGPVHAKGLVDRDLNTFIIRHQVIIRP
jgi:hypothetical protein